MNKICSECGAVLLTSVRNCTFCSSAESYSPAETRSVTRGNLTLHTAAEEEWRGELSQRLQAYRARRRKLSPNEGQTELPFGSQSPAAGNVAVQLDERPLDGPPQVDDFAFTIAIGRPPQEEPIETQLLIDVSAPPEAGPDAGKQAPPQVVQGILPQTGSGLHPVALLHERRRAAIIDMACLAFAYGGFLALFGSLGGHFTFSKLTATVYFFTFAFVYLQYVGLFTIFGGTTPGMMMRGLQVASFSGESPTSRQYLLRAIGYILSASTLCLGFLWALWDEDTLTWHDRLSRTYLTVPENLADAELAHPAPAR